MFQRLVALARRDRALTIALALAWLAALVPIWLPRFLPLLDQPNHLGQIAIWHRLSDPSWGYDRFYDYARLPVPYAGYYLPVHLLAYLLPLEIANKVYLSLYAAALPASVIALGARFGRSPWLALLAFPLIFSYPFSFGFISYCAGLPCMLFALAAIDAYLEAPSPKRLIALVALTLATYFMHFLPWMLLGVCALPLVLSAARRYRTTGLAAAALLLTVAWAWANYRMASGVSPLLPPVAHPKPNRYESGLDLTTHIHQRVLFELPGTIDEWCLVALLVSWLLLAATACRGEDEPWRFSLRELTPEVGFLVCLAAYMLAPYTLKWPLDWWQVSPRFVAPAALFGALLPRGAIAGWRRFLLAPALAACLIYPITLTARFLGFNQRAAGMAHLMAQVPRGSSTLTLMLDSNADPGLDPETVPFTEMHSWAQVLAGGDNPFQIAIGFPIKPRPGAMLPAPFWSRPREFRQDTMGARYDFVLTHNEGRDGEVFGALAARVRMVGHDGAWRLYATRDVR